MELPRVSSLPCKENENSFSIFSTIKEQSETSSTALQYPRTPLVDVQNKHNKGASGTRGSSRKFSIDSFTGRDIENQPLPNTPKRQEYKLKSRKSCFAVFNIPQDLDAYGNAAVGITLPRAIEEEPDNITLQSQMLSGNISALNSTYISGLKPIKSKADQSQHENVTSSSSQVCISIGESNELDLGCELTVTYDDTVVERYEQHKADSESSLDEICSHIYNDPETDLEQPIINSSQIMTDHGKSAASTAGLTLVSVVKAETDKFVNMLVDGCAPDSLKSFDSLALKSEADLHTLSQDHPYSGVSTGNRSSISQFEADRTGMPSPAGLSISHSTETSTSGRYFQEQQFYTPEPTHNISACHGYVTPLLSSPLDLINVSESSFKEELHKTDLEDLIQSYLLNNGSASEELSFSTPAASQLFESSLPPPSVYCDRNETYSSNESLSGGKSNILKNPVTHRSMDQVCDTVKVHLSNLKQICKLENEKGETVLENHCDLENEEGVTILENHLKDNCESILSESFIFITNNTSENNGSPTCGITSTPSFQGSVNQIDLIVDSFGNNENSMAVLSQKEHNPLTPVKINRAVSVATPMKEHATVNAESAVPEQTAVTLTTLTEQTPVSIDVSTNVDLSQAADGGTVFMDYPRIVNLSACGSVYKEAVVLLIPDHFQEDLTSPAANTSIIEQADASILTDPQAELTSAATNTSVIEQADASILTDPQAELTSAATNTSIIEQADSSILTDPQAELPSAATNTSIIEQADASILTDPQAGLTSAATNTSIIEQADASILTDHCQYDFVNTSMVTDVTMATNTFCGINVSMVTDCIDMFDKSAVAMPECLTQETMTDQASMVDTESSMTPLKLGKQGKRFTAEEIRRQHPRIVANQLETLMAANQRLDKEVGIITHDRDHLKSVLVEARSKLATADKQLSAEKERQGGVISVIEQCNHKTVESLESRMKDKQDRIEQLEFELKEVKQKYEKTQEDLRSSSLELQEKCTILEKLNCDAEQNFAEEIRKLHTQFEENNYHRAFLASAQVVRELQAEKGEFELLIEDIEGSASLQSQLQDSLHLVMKKSQNAVKDHSRMYERLVKENQTLYQEYTSMQTDLEVAMSENREAQEDIDNVNDILKRSNENYASLKEMYKIVSQDLDKSQAEIVELNGKIDFGYKIVKDLMEAKADLADELSQLQENNNLINVSLKSAMEEISNVQQQLEKERQISTANCIKYETIIAEQESSKSKMEITAESLRTTIDSWEVDREVQQEEIDTCLELVDSQRAEMKEMNKELKALRQVKAITQPEREQLQELKNTNQFLEAEKQLYFEAVTDYRTRLEAEMELTASNNALIEALRSNNTELQKSNDQLMSDVQILEEALSVKTVDNEMSWTAMENLQERMESCLASLQQKCNLQVKQASPTKATFSVPKTPSSSFCDGSSFVVQVLSAVKEPPPQPHSPNTLVNNQGISELHITSRKHDFENSSVRSDAASKAKLKQSNLHYGALQPKYWAEAEVLLSPHNFSSGSSQNARMVTDSKRSFNYSNTFVESDSADASLKCKPPKPSARKDISKLYSNQEQSTSTPGFAKICSIPSTIDRTLVSMTKVKGDSYKSADLMNSSLNNSSQCLESESVLSKVKDVDRLLTLIFKTVDMSEKATQLALEDLNEDFDLLKEKLKFQRCQNSDLEADLLQKSSQLIAAKEQMKDLNTRITGMTQSILNFQDQQLQIMRLEDEKADLNRKLRGVREEVSLLTDQLEEVVKKFDDVKSGQKSDGVSVREIISLKKKNHELIMKLFDERDKNKEVGEKAMRRIKILEDNWRKAESEVRRFDELVENIRETCIRSQAQLTHPAILMVVRLIDGIADQAPDKTPNKFAL